MMYSLGDQRDMFVMNLKNIWLAFISLSKATLNDNFLSVIAIVAIDRRLGLDIFGGIYTLENRYSWSWSGHGHVKFIGFSRRKIFKFKTFYSAFDLVR